MEPQEKSWFAMMMHLKADRRKYVAMEFKRFIRRARRTTLRIIGWQPSVDGLFSTWRTIERTGFTPRSRPRISADRVGPTSGGPVPPGAKTAKPA